jgi:anti-sigma-K factor RskA
MTRRRRPEPHTLSGAYLLDALSDSDRANFERHLARCPACVREVAELREVTAGLAQADAAEPPPALIRRVLQSAAQIRQLPPATGEASTRRIGRAPSDRTPGRLVPQLPPRLAGALAVVLLAAGAVLGAVAWQAEDEVGAAQQRTHQIAQVLNAPDAVMLTDRVETAGTATIIMSGRDHALVFTTAGLPRLPASRCYQLWLMGPAGDRSAGMLPSPRDGMTSPVIASGLRAGDQVGLTIEPDGGTSRPTGAPILLVPL